MPKETLLLLLADLILVTHALFVCFVVGGLLAIYMGHFFCWKWIRSRRFRIIHLLAITVVMVQSWAGMMCPLTVWENALRAKADSATYSGAFIQYWLENLLYYSAPEWVFIVLYTGFACLVLASWYWVRPES